LFFEEAFPSLPIPLPQGSGDRNEVPSSFGAFLMISCRKIIKRNNVQALGIVSTFLRTVSPRF
jgi:hypothetical protein